MIEESGLPPATASAEERVALVTGGATGLGLAISRELAAAGFRVAVGFYGPAREDAEAGARLLVGAGARISMHQVDIGAPEEVEAVVEEVHRTYGRLDVLVNNAGTTRVIPVADLEAVDAAVWNSIVDVNLRGTFLMCRAAASRMVETGEGAIVNIASSSAFRPGGGSSIPYTVSKAGIIYMTKALAVALAPKIRVNAVAPSTMETHWWDASPEYVRRYLEMSRFKRTVTVADVARVVVMLATNQSISGQTYAVDLANIFH